MRTIKLTISYDGTNYVGWQIQPNGVSIQGLVQAVLAKMTDEKISLIGASRTDAGVHALGHVAHFRTKTSIPCGGFIAGLNSLLPPDIAIFDAQEMPHEFHSRRDAKGKKYLYRILISPHRKPLMLNRFWHLNDDLDVGVMKKAAKCFIGEKDFSSFRAAGCASKSAVRRIDKIAFTVCHSESFDSLPLAQDKLQRRIPISHCGRGILRLWPQNDSGDKIINIEFEGNGFLRHMIRNIVGTIVDAGRGRLCNGEIKDILASRDRKKAGVSAPACGLYLVRVNY